MSSFSDYLVHSLISFGLPRQVCSSIFLRLRRCLSCSAGRVTVEMMGRGTTTSSVVFECSHCGLERLDFEDPVDDGWARMLAVGRLVDVDERAVN